MLLSVLILYISLIHPCRSLYVRKVRLESSRSFLVWWQISFFGCTDVDPFDKSFFVMFVWFAFFLSVLDSRVIPMMHFTRFLWNSDVRNNWNMNIFFYHISYQFSESNFKTSIFSAIKVVRGKDNDRYRKGSKLLGKHMMLRSSDY